MRGLVFWATNKTPMRGRKKARKLGKWANGWDGQLTAKYIARRRKQRQTARRSRSVNHARSR